MKTLFATLTFFVMMISFSQEVQKRQITSTEIDAIFSQWDTKDKAGIAVGILNDGKIEYAKGFGLANLEHKIPVNPETKFHIGDLAKEFTVYALLLLEQRGKLKLDDDVRKFIPKLSTLPNTISIKQLIHHTSGLNNSEVSKALAGWKADDVFTKEQAYDLVLNQAHNLPASGTTQRYTDAGFMILEDLISMVGKMPYAEFISKEIFEPLGMKHSVFDTQQAIITNKAQGYFPSNNSFVCSTMNPSQTIISDVYTTVEDMCLWAKELLNPKIGTQQMVEKFDSLSIVNNKEVEETNTALYTGGHRFWNFRGAKKLYHIEVAGGYASKLIRYPDYDLAVVIMGNDGTYNGYAATGASELYIEDFLENPVKQEATQIASKKISKKQLKAFEGDYWDIDSHTSRKIYVANDTLRYFRGSGNESPLVPLNNKSFKMITRGEVMVHFDTNVVPKTMTVKVGNDTFNLIAYKLNAGWSEDLSPFIGNYYSQDLNTSYSLSISKSNLILQHPRLETIQLSPRIKDTFTGNQRHFSALKFQRDTNGSINGFKLSTNGVNDIWFQKEVSPNENFTKSE
ncbi:serine hydrolase domain-containing protein [Psychroserpens sp. MEBiC05023]